MGRRFGWLRSGLGGLRRSGQEIRHAQQLTDIDRVAHQAVSPLEIAYRDPRIPGRYLAQRVVPLYFVVHPIRSLPAAGCGGDRSTRHRRLGRLLGRLPGPCCSSRRRGCRGWRGRKSGRGRRRGGESRSGGRGRHGRRSWGRRIFLWRRGRGSRHRSRGRRIGHRGKYSRDQFLLFPSQDHSCHQDEQHQSRRDQPTKNWSQTPCETALLCARTLKLSVSRIHLTPCRPCYIEPPSGPPRGTPPAHLSGAQI
jgi:hypothetical protein